MESIRKGYRKNKLVLIFESHRVPCNVLFSRVIYLALANNGHVIPISIEHYKILLE